VAAQGWAGDYMIDGLQAQLQRDEGLRLKPYTDSVGKLTIGYGRNLTDVGITVTEATILLENDIVRAHLDLLRELPWSLSLDDVRVGVLLNMAFNLGIHGLLGFKSFLRYVEKGEYENAALDMMTTLWARQVGARAERLATQMKTGQWQ
jgi:lysozyme